MIVIVITWSFFFGPTSTVDAGPKPRFALAAELVVAVQHWLHLTVAHRKFQGVAMLVETCLCLLLQASIRTSVMKQRKNKGENQTGTRTLRIHGCNNISFLTICAACCASLWTLLIVVAKLLRVSFSCRSVEFWTESSCVLRWSSSNITVSRYRLFRAERLFAALRFSRFISSSPTLNFVVVGFDESMLVFPILFLWCNTVVDMIIIWCCSLVGRNEISSNFQLRCWDF
jgi:hypothetical protein